jgi:hypothetical protein
MARFSAKGLAAAHALAIDPKTNSRANIIAKNEARTRLLSSSGGAWELVKIVQAHPGTTDDMRGELGLRIADEPAPTPPPSSRPGLEILMTLGRIVKVRLRDIDHPDKRGKPAGVEGATVLYFAGEQPSDDLLQWRFASNASKTVFDIEISSNVPAGEKLWLTAFWFNRRMQPSPPARPAATRNGDGLARAA